jgi:hypothetical protein
MTDDDDPMLRCLKDKDDLENGDAINKKENITQFG